MVTSLSLVVAAVSVVAALRPGRASVESGERDPQSSVEIARLRRQIVATESDAEALRAELDRLRTALQAKRTMEAQLAASGEDERSEEEKRQRVSSALSRLAEIVPRLSGGDEAAFTEMRDVFLTLARAPMEDPTLFRKAYEEARDPLTKTILLPHFLARDREGSADLLKQELQRSEDPQLRTAILERLRFSTNVAEDPEARAA
ncbi:MAG: hypothetical protein ACREQY_15450, partial [Candidatus Binatia bacterium]